MGRGLSKEKKRKKEIRYFPRTHQRAGKKKENISTCCLRQILHEINIL
jgi:hypothetical protein